MLMKHHCAVLTYFASQVAYFDVMEAGNGHLKKVGTPRHGMYEAADVKR